MSRSFLSKAGRRPALQSRGGRGGRTARKEGGREGGREGRKMRKEKESWREINGWTDGGREGGREGMKTYRGRSGRLPPAGGRGGTPMDRLVKRETSKQFERREGGRAGGRGKREVNGEGGREGGRTCTSWSMATFISGTLRPSPGPQMCSRLWGREGGREGGREEGKEGG